MGGGGGFSPIPIITTLIFGPEAGGLVAAGLGALQSPGRTADSGAAQAAEAENTAEAAEIAAEERRRSDRRRQETYLLDQARTARRVDLAGQNALAQTLGAPAVETPQLKEKLGQ